MKLYSLIVSLFLIISNSFSTYCQTTKKPNIIYILTDDLGYGDVGVFFQNELKKLNDRSKPFALTPNLDKMANNGAKLTNHYAAAPVCAPSRASLLTGLSQGHANVRDNQFDKALADNYTIGNVLQNAGYKTAVIGKWGLQGGQESLKGDDEKKAWVAHPLNRGFDYYYGYMRHGDGHEHYPVDAVYGKPKEVYENNNEVSKGLDKSYTGDLFTAVAKKWITEQTNSKKDNGPFFMYLAYDTPHAVLELPTQAYPKGGGLKGGIQWLGKPGNMINTASGIVDSWIHPDYINSTYDHDQNPTTAEIAWPNVYKRYATITRRIDDQIADVLKLLKDLKIDDNTLVVFSSDNGPSIESYLKEPFKANFFKGFGPFDGIKRDVLEGGLRVPTIAFWPKNIPKNTVINTPNISYDWLPTFAHAAGLTAPINGNGVSILPSLIKKGNQQESLVYVEYAVKGKSPNYTEFSKNNRGKERNQMQMLRSGEMVGVRYNIDNNNTDFEIYNINKDSHQENNLAKDGKMDSLQSFLKERILQIRVKNSSALRPYDDDFVPAAKIAKQKNGLNWATYKNDYLWIPNITQSNSIENGIVYSLNTKPNNEASKIINVYKAYIKVPEDGKYTFYLNANNKAFIKLHEINLIDADFNYKVGSEKTTSINLKEGLHPIEIYVSCDSKSNEMINLEWESLNLKRTKISNQSFFIKD